MQREIKFRAWNKELGEMWVGGYVQFDTGNIWFENEDGDMFGYTQEEFPLMQYTGLKDYKGKEIYEGDIVVGQEKEAGFPPYDSTEPRVIEFRNGCWCFNAGRYDDGDWIRFGFWTYSNEGRNQLKQLEVIGNVWENLELLKGA